MSASIAFNDLGLRTERIRWDLVHSTETLAVFLPLHADDLPPAPLRGYRPTPTFSRVTLLDREAAA